MPANHCILKPYMGLDINKFHNMMGAEQSKVDCSIVIVNYNTSELILSLLESIKKYCLEYTYEFIVVDNDSPNDDVSRVAEKYSDVRLILNNENAGFGRANNLGIENSNGKFVLLLNSDTLLFDNALDRCIEFMRTEFAIKNNIGLMGCELLNRDMSHQNSTFDKFKLSGYLISSNILLSRFFKRGPVEKNEEGFTAAVSGAFMLFRKEVFEKIKPFDPDIFMYSEETELCRERVSKLFNIYYWKGAQIIHFGGASSGGKMHLQELVSYALTWYKKGAVYYTIYVISFLTNLLFELILLVFISSDGRERIVNKVRFLPKWLYYVLYSIPRFSNEWGSRDRPLKAI